MITFFHLLSSRLLVLCIFPVTSTSIYFIHIHNMATLDDDRKASTASPPNYDLANEDDAALLGMSICRGEPIGISDIGPSKAWVQTRVATELYYDRSLWHRLQYNGTLAIHCIHTVIFHSCRSCRNGLGE